MECLSPPSLKILKRRAQTWLEKQDILTKVINLLLNLFPQERLIYCHFFMICIESEKWSRPVICTSAAYLDKSEGHYLRVLSPLARLRAWFPVPFRFALFLFIWQIKPQIDWAESALNGVADAVRAGLAEAGIPILTKPLRCCSYLPNPRIRKLGLGSDCPMNLMDSD